MKILFRIVAESAGSAWRELRVNKLRTFLTLSGIAIGIFCIISIFSSVDSLEKNLRSGIDKLGNQVVYINKFPWAPEEGDTEYPWWRYWNRPYATDDEMRKLQDNLTGASAGAISIWMGGPVVEYEDRNVRSATINGVSQDYDKIFKLDFAVGRYFTPGENLGGDRKVILGYDVAQELFPNNVDPIGSEVGFMGDQLTVIGVFAKEGKSIVETSNDNVVMMPYHYLTSKVEVDGFNVEPTILVEAKDGISLDELKDELKGVMRGIRRISPKSSDNFSLNSISIISGQITSLFGIMNVVGGIIGFFAVLVGGFGIANIMFVSVRERTNQIGIKKALGAKRYFILLEFLIEAVVLAIFGGLIGLLLVFLILKSITSALDFTLALDFKNIMLGIGFSSIIGFIAGLIPAVLAARLDPVTAIRFK